VNQAAFNLVCNPLKSKRKPSTIPEAQFSLPYCLGVVLTKQAIFLDDFSEDAITNVEYLNNAGKVDVVVDPEIEKSAGRKIGPAKIRLNTNKGSVFEIEKHDVKGQPQNPMTMEEIEEKFRKCASFSTVPLESSDITKTIDYVGNLEALPDASVIVSGLCPERCTKQSDSKS
jgi:2-methylcitrate dehydratase PrpD